MFKKFVILTLSLLLADISANSQNSLRFRGQLSAWTGVNANIELPGWLGGRYIPQLNFENSFGNRQMIDMEASANLYNNTFYSPFDTISASSQIKPYRLWARYSGTQFELRIGLQKINFGSASLLRPLMWFDTMDPRDPLQLTDGVWGALARYYFLNNATIWFWALYGNNETKGWETLRTSKNTAETGARFQLPIPKGEAALSWHYRKVDPEILQDPLLQGKKINENRLGFDIKLDMVIGCWLEASWVHNSKKLGMFTNQKTLNIGADYTFGLGNGLVIVFEQLFMDYSEKTLDFDNPLHFSMINLSYPPGMFDNLGLIVYYNWNDQSLYNFINWQRQLNKFSLYLMGWINPKTYNIPTRESANNMFAGTGAQIMVVFNH